MKTKLPKVGTKAHKELKWKESIEIINNLTRVKLAPSEINGIGVVAIEDIKKGEKLNLDAIPNYFDLPYSKFKKLKPQAVKILLGHFPLIATGSQFWYPLLSFQAFMNHSAKPNYDGVKDVALRDIKKDEELTEDYKKIDKKAFKKINEDYPEIYKFMV